MPVDVSKQLDKATKYLERNKLAEAAEAYLSAINDSPGNQEALQGLGDICTRLGQPDRAATYYGTLFDRLCEAKDENKATALYTRALRGAQQPPERMARYALLLQKQGRTADAIENYVAASELLLARGKMEPALDCLERVAQLEPENAARQFAAGSLAEQLGKSAVAVKAYLRAAQLAEASGESDTSLDLLQRAHGLAPEERSPALLYARAALRRGDAATAVALLDPHADTESDAEFLNTLSEALTAAGELDRASVLLEKVLPQDPSAMRKLFDVAALLLNRGEDQKAVAVLSFVHEWAHTARRDGDFATNLESVAEPHPRSAPLAEFCAAAYAALNRESGYFDALVRLFDIYMAAGNAERAGDALDKLVEIDPYDFRNQNRLTQLAVSGDPVLVERIRSRLSQVVTHSPQAEVLPKEAGDSGVANREEEQGLDDLMVQAEIFLQYSLQNKAIEKLEQIAALFPGEESRNPRLRSLYQMGGWWPDGNEEPAPGKTQATPRQEAPAAENADTLRDLAQIAKISQSLHRQPSAKAILATAIQEVGQFLHATRCFATLGQAGQPPQMASEYLAPGAQPAPAVVLMRLLAQLEQAEPDGLGCLLVQRQAVPSLADLGLDSAIGLRLLDSETKEQAGVIVAGYASAHAWRPHEKFFLQAVGDQMLLSINHTRLRTMARTLGAADEKTGLLARSAYLDCLIQEAQRAKSQSSTLSVVLVQIDRGAELLRQHGEAALEHYLEQFARTLRTVTRQTDLAIKYTSWAIALILPDTPTSAAESLAERVRQAGAGVRPAWDGPAAILSASVAEAVARPDFDSEDIVTELVNRAQAGLEEARVRGGGAVVSLAVHELKA
jgi:diguanylate cyclase (GGDEF)-like protein